MAEIERTDLRTLKSKTFELGDGRFHLQMSGRIQHYVDDTGQLRDIVPIWALADGVYSLGGSAYRVRVPATRVAYQWQDRSTGGSVDVRLYSVDGVLVRDLLLTFTLEADGPRLWWRNVLPDLDFFLLANPNTLGFHKLLKSASAPRDFVVEITEDLAIPKSKVQQSSIPGRDNLERLVDRVIDSDRFRVTEMLPIDRTPDVVKDGRRTYRVRTAWTGRVAEVDPVTRIKTWSTKAAYPVRIT